MQRIYDKQQMSRTWNKAGMFSNDIKHAYGQYCHSSIVSTIFLFHDSASSLGYWRNLSLCFREHCPFYRDTDSDC